MFNSLLWLQIKCILWKNFIIRTHHPFQSAFEIITPILSYILIGVLLKFYSQLRTEVTSVPTYAEQLSIENIYASYTNSSEIWYTPETDFLSEVFKNVRLKLNLKEKDILRFYSETTLLSYYNKHGKKKKINAVVFKNINQKKPKHFNYVIMPGEKYGPWKLRLLYNVLSQYITYSGSIDYFKNGFIALQTALDTSLIEVTTSKNLPVSLSMQEFPYPPQKENIDKTVLFKLFEGLTIYGFILIPCTILTQTVQEKQTGIKELMKMMGLKSWMHWLGWFFYSFVINFIAIIVMVILATTAIWNKTAILEYCDVSIFFILLVMYCAAAITFCFALSVFFYKPTFAMIFGLLIWGILNELFSKVIEASVDMSWGRKLLFALFPNMALKYAFDAIEIYERRNTKLTWENIYGSADGTSNDVTMGYVLLILLIDIVIYLVILFYFEDIFPGEYGLAKPFYYPVSYLMSKKNNKVENENNIEPKSYSRIEPAPNLKPGIQIRNLYKKFGKLTAVDDLSIDIYEQEITVLLGHNGAGKTTTMSIITGMCTATSGQVYIDGIDINDNMNKVRSSMGLCPQHNLHFTDLTVIEHLTFFGMLKGLSLTNAKSEAIQYLRKMNIYAKRNTITSQLSGGMKRKLSLGIALIGNPNVIILDEPTSGLDPEARREIWDMFLTLRGSHTIIITTHFMEEADVLGDRIAILDHGQLICYGTSMFLKNEYGTGYHLTITGGAQITSAQTQAVTAAVQTQIANAFLQSSSGNRLNYLLPYEAKPYFSKMFEELEGKRESLGITNIGISVTTLEEVFLRVGSITASEDHTNITNDSNNVFTMDTSPKLTGLALFIIQLWTLMKKRWYYLRKKWRFTLSAVFILLLATFVALENTRSTTTVANTFDINLKIYGKTTVFYGSSESDEVVTNIAQKYIDLVKGQRGTPQKVTSVSNAIINEGKKNIIYYSKNMVIAAEFNVTNNKKSLNAMYSYNSYHGAPISLNLITNAILIGIAGDEYFIKAANSPFSPFAAVKLAEGGTTLSWNLMITVCLFILTTSFISFLHVERVTKVKQLQLMCGVRSITYLLSCYIFDLILYFLSILALILFMVTYNLFRSTMLVGAKQLGAFFIILFTYGLSAIPFAYLFSYRRSAMDGTVKFLIVSISLNGAVLLINLLLILARTVFFNQELFFDNYYVKLIHNILYCLCILPPFGITFAIAGFLKKTVSNHEWTTESFEEKLSQCRIEHTPCCDGMDTTQCKNYLSYYGNPDSITYPVLIMAFSFLIYFVILLVLESNFLFKYWEKFKLYLFEKYSKENDINEQDDIKAEMERISDVLAMEKQNVDTEIINDRTGEAELLLVHKLQKMYGRQKILKGISFGINPGDCFGLLGVNGAGKTTTFRILTGDLPLATGEARILMSNNKKVYLSRNTTKYLRNVGYCPQFDAINGVLTGRQMLMTFAELRGMSEGVTEEVNKCVSALGLQEYVERQCGQYSGGNKRKLSIAMALIAGPPLLMFDEPTSGVDPISRRKLWDILTALQNQEVKPSIILTSHSMEECEALCARLAIMKAGQLECCGAIPDLKNKFGQGFTIMLKLKQSLLISVDEGTPESSLINAANVNQRQQQQNQISDQNPPEVQKVMVAFEKMYRGSFTLRDKHPGLLHYHINDTTKKWSQLFKEIEKLQVKYPIIEDYTISETTLEEIFLSIARNEAHKTV